MNIVTSLLTCAIPNLCNQYTMTEAHTHTRTHVYIYLFIFLYCFYCVYLLERFLILYFCE